MAVFTSSSGSDFRQIFTLLYRICPASPEKEDPSAAAATSALYSAGPVVSDLHLI